MLTQIHIRNFAIIDEIELDLRGGMTVLTGETGAGKSILVDALGMVLGDRADAGWIRHGQARAEISATFDIANLTAVRGWLEEHDLDSGDECLIRRVIADSGRSKGYINGSPAPLALLKELGERLVDIHGQHQHQSLIKTDVQRRQLDEYGKAAALQREVAQLYRDWHECSEKLTTLRAAAEERNQRLDLLRFQSQELNELALKEGELEALHQEHKRLANSDQLIDDCTRILHGLSEADEQNLEQGLSRQIQALTAISNDNDDAALNGVGTMLNDALIQVQEAANELRHYLDTLEVDPERLQWVESRLSDIHDAARKHRVEAEMLLDLQSRIDDELASLSNADVEIDHLVEQLATLEQAYLKQTDKLSKARKKAAKALSSAVSKEVRELGMPDGQFVVNLIPRADGEFHRHGREQISFEVSSNPGQPPRPLGKVASGGELSRLSLAIQVLLTGGQEIPTLIFDEVDTGIGGAVAETVGRLLRRLGQSHQVLCVTHLPQVAALGHNHIQVSKQADKKSTTTRLELLEEAERCDEIARMLGGMEITEQTRAHAEEMIGRAQALN